LTISPETAEPVLRCQTGYEQNRENSKNRGSMAEDPEGYRPGEITLLLQRWSEGESGAVEQLAPLVYDHLRSVAAGYLNRERAGVTLQATGLVNELFVRLLKQKRAELTGRAHFFTFAARMMRRILVDAARARTAVKRGAPCERLSLSPELAWVDPREEGMLDLDQALDELAAAQPDKARIVELRVFLGCTSEETAELESISKATVDREMRFALAWLYKRIQPKS
jgi:RNA polymerase sigma factor (TIGR02999 family)